MAHHGPVRLSLKGDRVAAARFIRTGRALLWKLEQESAGASARRTHNLPDGVTITVQIAGRQSMIDIYVPLPEGEEVEVVEHFVTWPRTEAQPDGIDPDHPQLMHRVEDDVWRTLFYDPDIEGYEDFERPKGTYRTEAGVPVFPDGVRHAGNVDWRSEAGVRVSWYGPSTRYLLDPYVQPRAQFGKKVFMLGQVLLDTDAYMAASDEEFDETYIMGAALSPSLQYLVTVQADLPVGVTLTGNAPPNTLAAYPPFPTTDPSSTNSPVPITVCRYRVARNPEDPTSFSVVPESREVLTAGVFQRALHPWFFNQSATAAVSVAFPEILTSTWTSSYSPPSPTNQVLLFSEGGITTRDVTAAPGAPGTVCADFRGDTLVELSALREAVPGPNNLTGPIESCRLVLGTASWDVQSVSYTSAPTLTRQMVNHRALMWADLRAGTVVFSRMVLQGRIPTDMTITFEVELWHGTALVARTPLDYDAYPAADVLPRTYATASLDATVMLNMNVNTPVAPLFVMYGSLIAFVGFSSIFSFHGRLALLWTGAYPQSAMFGQYAMTGSSPAPYTIVASQANFASELTDFGGHLSVLGAASYQGASMLSCYDFGTRGGAAVHMMSGPEAGMTLPVLTGVTGPKERYHPIWLLGALPRTEV